MRSGKFYLRWHAAFWSDGDAVLGAFVGGAICLIVLLGVICFASWSRVSLLDARSKKRRLASCRRQSGLLRWS